ncbi:MAG: hypothetical protein KDB82_01110 [Planctomycetes bacterium]|nr:hypothetical protein [Planctomycetota bacterium]
MQTRNPPDLDAALRERLQLLVQEHPQAEIARKTGVGKHNVSRYLKGTKIPGEFLSAIVTSLGVNPAWLLAGEGTPYLSDVTSGTAKMAGNLLELVQAMSEVARMRLGALTGKTHLKVLRQLDEALRGYEKLRDELNSQSRPFLENLLVDFQAALRKQDLDRCAHLSRAAHQLMRLSDDEEMARELNGLEGYRCFLAGDNQRAIELQRKVFLGWLTGFDEVNDRTLREAFNFARALEERGRFAQARDVAAATLELTRALADSSRYQLVRTHLGWLEFCLGDLRAGMPKLIEGLARTEPDDRRTISGCVVTAQLVGGTINWRGAAEIGSQGVSRSSALLRWAFISTDAETIEGVRKIAVGEHHDQVLPGSFLDGSCDALLRLVHGEQKAWRSWHDEAFTPQLRRATTGLGRFNLYLQAATIAVAGGVAEAVRLVLDTERELENIPAGVLPHVLWRIRHNLNAVHAAKGSRSKPLKEVAAKAHDELQRWIDAGCYAIKAMLPQ